MKQVVSSEGNIFPESRFIAEELNNYFGRVGATLAISIVPQSDVNYEKACTPNSIYISETSMQEVEKTIMSLTPRTAQGADVLRVDLLKSIAGYSPKPLTCIISRSFSTVIFPDAFKEAIVKPL